jgi:hypothetical protein
MVFPLSFIASMKKKLLIALGAVTTILVMSIVVIGFKANAIVASFKPQIEEQLSKALGTKVSLSNLSVSVFPSAKLSVEDVQVLNAAGTTSSLSVGALKAALSLSALLSKKLAITELEIAQPRITIVKDSTGVSISGITPGAPAPQQPKTTAPNGSAVATGESLALDIDRIVVTNGDIRFDDRTTKRITSLSKVNLDAGVSMEGSQTSIPSANISLVLDGKTPLSLSGKDIIFNKSTGGLAITSMKLTTRAGDISANGTHSVTTQAGAFTLTSSGLDLAKLASLTKDISPTLDQFKTNGSLAFTLSVTTTPNAPLAVSGPISLGSVSAEAPGAQIRDLTATIQTGGNVQNISLGASAASLKLNGTPLMVDTQANITPTSVVLSSLTIKGFGGEIKAPTTLGLGTPQTFSSQPVMKGLSIAEISKTFQPTLADVVTGTIATFEGSFTGTLGTNLANSVSGSGALFVKDGALKGVNLPNLVLSKITNIPLLEGSLRNYIAPEHQKYFDTRDTALKQVSCGFRIQSGTISINTLEAQSDAFNLTSNGTVKLDGELKLSSTIAFAPDISASMAKRSKTVTSMLVGEGRLAIPILIQGKSPLLLVVPDITKLVQGAGVKALEQKAGDALNKLLGGKGKDKQPLKGLLGF